MRLLTVIDHLGPGGRQRCAQNYAVGYARAGHASAVLAVRDGGPREAELRRAGVPVFVADGADGADGALAEAAAWAPDVVHVHSSGPIHPVTGEALERLLARLPGVAVLDTSSFGKVDYEGPAYRRAAYADVVLVKGGWALWRWEQWTRPLDVPVATVVPNAIDVDAFGPSAPAARAAFRRAHGVPPEAVVFGRIGQPHPAKWSPMLLDAFAAVARRRPEAALLLVGAPASFAERIARLPAAVRARVVSLPFLHGDDALRAGYGAMDVFVHAARKGESFGQVLAEAMACEVPVVTLSRPSRDNTQLEVVGHERGGLVVNDARGMAEAMGRLMDDPALRRRLARDGAAHVRSHYALDVVVGRLLAIAEAAREADSQAALRARLDAAGLVTSVSDADVEALLGRSIGRPPLAQRVLKRLIHTPLVARAYFRLRGV